MLCKELTDKAQITQYLFSPEIRQSLFDEDQGALELNPTSRFLGLYEDEELIGVLRFEPMNLVTAFVHSHMHPKHWGHNKLRECLKISDKWFKENTKIHKQVSTVPVSCKEVALALLRNGYTIEGNLVGGCYWRGEVQNLVLFSRFIGD